MQRVLSYRIWALALSVLALAFPPSALGAHAGGSRPRGTQSTTGRLGHAVLLAPGSGYYSSQGWSSVRAIQRRLALAGYAPGPIDGRYGSLTSRAVLAFQAARGLHVDGIVGPRTWAALTRSGLVLSPGAGDQPGGSERVRVLQRRLARAGYSPGPVDGHYGLLTERAVRRFQTTHGLRVDGTAGPQTLARVREPARSVHRLQHRSPVVGSSPRHARSHRGQPPARKPAATPGVARPPVATPGVARPPVATPGVARPPVATPGVVRPPVARPSHRGSGPPAAAVLILGALGLALILTAGWYVLLRRSDRRSPTPKAAVHAKSAPALVHDTSPVERRDHQATVATNGAGNGAAATNGAGNGASAPTLGASAEQGAPAEAAAAPPEAESDRADQDRLATRAFSLGVLLEERGEIAEAEAAYRRADQRGHGAAGSNLGVLLEERGAWDEAEAAYRRADQHGDATGSFNLGVLLKERGEIAEAEAAYRRADQRGRGEVADIARAALLDLRGGLEQSASGFGFFGAP